MMLFHLLERSAASAAFREGVRAFLETTGPNDAVAFPNHLPPVKVERTLLKILESYPDQPIETVKIRGSSGCEYFRGVATIQAGAEEIEVRFDWDCKWKAIQLGWSDYFGFPDQGRAAREFGHDCFKVWDDLTIPLLTTA
jgi:hypothetical protein